LVRFATPRMVHEMSRVYRALEKAEREKEKTTGVAPSLPVFKEETIPRPEKTIPKVPPRQVEKPELPPKGVLPVFIPSPESFAAEQFRKIRTQIFHWSSKPSLSIMITSTIPDEGKTTVSVNLAAVISQEIQKKVILIDADLRKPSIFLREGQKHRGLSDYLSDQTPLPDIVLKSETENLWIIQAGQSSPRASELIGSRKMRDLFSTLREMAEFGEETYIIVDSTPILATTEPVLLSKFVDGVILVVRADHAPKESVRRAFQSIDRQKIIGVVFNQKDLNPSSSYYSGYHYGYPKK
jgi:capsular exopolysaccharide synthesis family protein